MSVGATATGSRVAWPDFRSESCPTTAIRFEGQRRDGGCTRPVPANGRCPNAETLELGFAAFYLNRTIRSGDHSWRDDRGKSPDRDLSHRRPFRAGGFGPANRKGGELRAPYQSPQQGCGRLQIERPSGHFGKAIVYLDPPYYANGSRLYRNTYKHPDHAKIAGLVGSTPHPWIMSYDNAEPIRALYSAYRQQTFGLGYSANARYEGTEVMVFSDALKIVACAFLVYAAMSGGGV